MHCYIIIALLTSWLSWPSSAQHNTGSWIFTTQRGHLLKVRKVCNNSYCPKVIVIAHFWVGQKLCDQQHEDDTWITIEMILISPWWVSMSPSSVECVFAIFRLTEVSNNGCCVEIPNLTMWMWNVKIACVCHVILLVFSLSSAKWYDNRKSNCGNLSNTVHGWVRTRDNEMSQWIL